MKPKNKYALAEVRKKVLNYCAKQEHCHFEVNNKLKEWGADYSTRQTLLAYLVEHNFLNEQRFANLYVRSKFNQKNWGWQKIKQGLIAKKISEACIQEAHRELNPVAYRKKAEELMRKKMESYQFESKFEARLKAEKYLLQKGYEFSLVKNLLKNND